MNFPCVALLSPITEQYVSACDEFSGRKKSVWKVNDFDMALEMVSEWDIKRLWKWFLSGIPSMSTSLYAWDIKWNDIASGNFTWLAEKSPD